MSRARHARDDEPITEPIVLPAVYQPPPAHRDLVAWAEGAGAGAVSRTTRGAALIGSALAAGGRGMAGQLRAEIAARRPSAPAGTDLSVAVLPPARVPWLSVSALLACGIGIVGLLLPLIEVAGGFASVALIDIPYVGMPLLALFLLLSALPLLDVLQRRLRWTGWLVVPALMGWAPVGLVLFAVPWVPHALRLVWATAPEELVATGSAPMALAGADALLTFIAILVVAIRMRARVER